MEGTRQAKRKPLREVDWFPFVIFGKFRVRVLSFCLLQNDTRDLEVSFSVLRWSRHARIGKMRFTDGRIHHPFVGYESFISAALLDFAVKTKITIVVFSVNDRSYRVKKKKSLPRGPCSSRKYAINALLKIERKI